MESTEIERFRKMLSAGMEQYHLKPADLADHPHLRGRLIPRFNDERTITCLCRGANVERIRSVTKLYEHALESGRSISPDWAYRMLCMMHAATKVAAWRASRDPGEDDWLWDMDHARLSEPWGDPDPRILDWRWLPVAIPNKQASERLAREIARELANKRNRVGQPWIRRVDEVGVASLLAAFFEANREDMASSFSSWYEAINSQYRVVVDDSKREITRMLIRDGRKSRVEDVSTGDSSFSIQFKAPRTANQGDRPPKVAEAMYAFLTHDVEREARENSEN